MDITLPLTMIKLHILLTTIADKFKITSGSNTLLLRELFTTTFSSLDRAFINLQMDNNFPNLIVLGLSHK